MIGGKVWKYGDHVNTDLIIPGRYLDDYDVNNLAAHAMEDIDPSSPRLRTGDISGRPQLWVWIIAGAGALAPGCREGAIIAESVARIFYRNAINVGPSHDCVQ